MKLSSIFVPVLGAAVILSSTACGPKNDKMPPAPKTSAAAGGSVAEAPMPPPAGAASAPAVAIAKAKVSLPTLGTAPAWQLKDLNGNVVSSEQFKGKVVVVDFWATWCGPCRMAAPIVDEVARRNVGVLITLKVDTDAAKDAALRHRIQSIPTFVVFQGGREVARRMGVVQRAELERWISEHTLLRAS